MRRRIRYLHARKHRSDMKKIWNPWHGCHKCSAGCKNCFVYYLDGLRDRDASIVTRSKSSFDLPLKKSRNGEYKIPPGSEIATCFTSDFFIEEADEWRAEAWNIIKSRPDVTFLIATKRIERAAHLLPDRFGQDYDNVRIAVSCENQAAADDRLPHLLDLEAKHKCIFVAPILEYVDLKKHLASGEIELVSVGGESYKNARTCDFDWIKSIKRDCDEYKIPFDFHQTGSNFVMNGKRYRINHSWEYEQAAKAAAYLNESSHTEIE